MISFASASSPALTFDAPSHPSTAMDSSKKKGGGRHGTTWEGRGGRNSVYEYGACLRVKRGAAECKKGTVERHQIFTLQIYA